MCFVSHDSNDSTTPGPPYTSSALNSTTHLVVHRDKYHEYPFLYVKLYQDISLAVVIDTGCGARNGLEGSEPSELKDFIHGTILPNNQVGFDFLVVCTHCHFDHIGGIEAFAQNGAKIIASGHDRTFLDPGKRKENSLCGNFRTGTPEYDVSHYTRDREDITHNGQTLGLQILHTPGHTPDSLAVYDTAERWLYVGDTCYQRTATMPWGEKQVVPIVLPLQGNWRDFRTSLHKLEQFVADMDETGSTVQLAAGHTTSHRPAAEFLRMVIAFCERVIAGTVDEALLPGDAVAPGGTLGDQMFVQWTGQEGEELALLAPERFKEDF